MYIAITDVCRNTLLHVPNYARQYQYGYVLSGVGHVQQYTHS